MKTYRKTTKLENRNGKKVAILIFIITNKRNFTQKTYTWWGEGPRGVMVKAMDFGIAVSEFEF